MLNKIIIKAPAKINLFLNILDRRNDGYHNIRSGITFINLFDEVFIKKSNAMSIKYYGNFKPQEKIYKDCIIKKTLKFLELDNKINLEIKIKKNIPVQSGLGSASTNAAALIKGLEKLQIIKKNINYNNFSFLGSDIPVCLFRKNSIIEGIGDIIYDQVFPNYYFLLVMPPINFSTKHMYNKIIEHRKKNPKKFIIDNNGNDFEKVLRLEYDEIDKLLNFLSNTDHNVFSKMTGSGSCCYAVFKNHEYSKKALLKASLAFPHYWSFLGNNFV